MATDVSATMVSEEQLREACAELDRRLRALEPIGVEDVLKRLPGLSADSVVELIYTEFVVREELGRQLQPADWFARFPDMRERLGRLMQVHQALHHAESPDTATAIGAVDDTGFSVTEKAAERGVPGYEILEELGRGGMGVVYKARQLKLNRVVALKMILTGDLSGPEERARFQEEAQAAARLQHPNIVQVFEIGVADGRPFLALEFVAGDSLAHVLIDGPLESRAAAQLVATLARASHYAHSRGVIHRDLKPGNILLSPVGDRLSAIGQATPADMAKPIADSRLPIAVPKIIDFGLAKQWRDAAAGEESGGITRTGMVLGTPSYMSPEQASGSTADLGPSVDIYALGTILYEALTGRPPFRAATPLETLDQVRTQEPVPPARLQPGLPRDLETICLKCLQKNPDRRYPRAQELAEDIERFMRGEAIRARPTARWERGVKWARRRPAIAALVAALAIVLMASFVAVTLMWRQTAGALSREQDARQTAEASLAARNVALARYEWSACRLDRAREHLQECPQQYRDAEWLYLQRACTAEVASFGPHDGKVNALAYRPDGEMLAIVQNFGTLTLRDAATGQEVSRFSDPAAASQYVGFSSQGTHVCHITGAFTNAVGVRSIQSLSVWDVAQSERVRFWTGPFGFDRARFSRFGPFRVAVATPDGIRVEDVLTGETIRTFALGLLPALDLSPDGNVLAASENEHAIFVWDLTTGARIALLETTPVNRPRRPHLVALAGDGRRLAHVVTRENSPTNQVTIWDYRAAKTIVVFLAHAANITSLAFSPDGAYLATGSNDRTVILWDTATGREVITLRGHLDRVSCLAFSPDGRYLASGSDDRTVRIWNTRFE